MCAHREEVVTWGRAVCFHFFLCYSSLSGSTQMDCFCCSAWGFTSLQREEGSGDPGVGSGLTAQCGEQSPCVEAAPLMESQLFSISIACSFLKNTAVIFRKKNSVLIHLL